MKRFLAVFLLSAVLLQFGACKRDGTPSWDVGVVVPLAHASLSINNLIGDSLSSSNADGSIKLVYSSKIAGLSMDTLFNIPDTTVSNIFAPPITLNITAGSPITPTTPNQTTFGASGAQIVYGILTHGQMFLHLQNDIRRRVIVRYQIPCASLNSIPFDMSYTIPAAADSLHAEFMDVTIDLSGYSIDFTGANHDRVNTLTTTFTARIDPTDNDATIYTSDTVGVNNTMKGIKPYYIRGYFGNETTQIGPDETDFPIFKKVIAGSLGLDSLKMSLSIDNYIGMDSRLTINSIWSRNTRTNHSVYLNNSVMGMPINVNRAQYTNSWLPVVPSSYNFVFDNSNSNAKALVENLPDKLGYDFTLITNPLGNVSGNNDFLFANYTIDSKLNIEMPLNLFADQLVTSDTVLPDFSSFKNRDKILKGTLTLFAENSFPFEADMNLYFIDVLGNITGSVVAQPNAIASSPTNIVGGYVVSVGHTSSQLSIPLNETQTQALLNSTKIIFVSKFDTHSIPMYAKIFDTNHLDLKLTANFDYRVGN